MDLAPAQLTSFSPLRITTHSQTWVEMEVRDDDDDESAMT